MTTRILLTVLLAFGVAFAEDSDEKAENTAEKAIERCHESASLLDQIMATPENAIPRGLLVKARCIALIPGVKKAGFVFAGKYGKGFLACRGGDGVSWQGPSALRLEGGSFGFQVGGSSTDVILLVMNEEGVEKLLSSKFTLGADAAVAGGPVGRSAQVQTDAQMHAKILAYSRSRGLFAGLSLEGATLRPDSDANRKLYGSDIPAKQILAGGAQPLESTRALLYTLAKYATPKAGEPVEEPSLPPAPPEEKPEPTLLTVTSEPGYAEVELNRNFNGLTPRTKQIAPGQYQITVNKKGFEPWVKTVTVTAGEAVTIHAKLDELETAGADEEASAATASTQNTAIRISGWQPKP
jgi:lipid-binding SYLF domain-containing protein